MEKLTLEKNGLKFDFIEGFCNGKPEMNVNHQGESASIRYVSDEKIIFQFSIQNIGGIDSHGVEKEQYQKVKKLYESIKAKREAQKEKEDDEKYSPLYTVMEKISLPKNNENPDDKKCQGLLEVSKKNAFYSNDPEDEGLNLAVSSQRSKIEAEAQKYCNHIFKMEFWRTYTQDARLKLQRDVSCEKCGFFKRDIVKEEISDEVMMRC